MTGCTLPRARSAPLLFGAALSLLPVAASGSDLCDPSRQRNVIQFEKGRGRSVTESRELREPAPRGSWRIDAGENGSVAVTAWDEDGIHVCAQVVAWSSRDKEAALEVARSIRIELEDGVLKAEGPPQSNSRRWGVSYWIHAPRKSDLSLRAVNGGVEIDGLRGRLDLHTVNGPVRIRDAGGDVRARTLNGPVDVELTGSSWSGPGLDVETTNGPLLLAVPERYSASLEAGTSNGPFQVDFPITVEGRMTHKIKTVLGEGGPPIRAVTTNGPAAIGRPGRHVEVDEEDAAVHEHHGDHEDEDDDE